MTATYFAHANLNTADLRKAEAFYCDGLGLSVLGRMETAIGQDGAPFALAGREVHWRGAFLADERGRKGPVVDLLQWTAPPTEAIPPQVRRRAGLAALSFLVGDLDATAEKLVRHGGRPQRCVEEHGGERQETVWATDPDGSWVHLRAGDRHPRFDGIRVVAHDLSATIDFYRGVVGLEIDPPVPYRISSEGRDVEAGRVARAYLPGQRDKFHLDLVQTDAGTLPNGRRGNHAGVYRMALLVDDIEAAHAHLARRMDAAPAPVYPDIGGGYGPVPAIFFADPNGAVVEYLVGVLK